MPLVLVRRGHSVGDGRFDYTFSANTAVVSGRLDIDGTMHPVGKWRPLKFMSTWVKADGRWRLLSRSLTPCLDRLIEMGGC